MPPEVMSNPRAETTQADPAVQPEKRRGFFDKLKGIFR
jgi:hypothetical protein